MWQDIIITITILAFSYALIPQVVEGFRNNKGSINLQTSLITSIGMFVLSVVYATLGLYFSTIVALLTGGLWTTLFFQKIFYK